MDRELLEDLSLDRTGTGTSKDRLTSSSATTTTVTSPHPTLVQEEEDMVEAAGAAGFIGGGKSEWEYEKVPEAVGNSGSRLVRELTPSSSASLPPVLDDENEGGGLGVITKVRELEQNKQEEGQAQIHIKKQKSSA